jgi:integron integrase
MEAAYSKSRSPLLEQVRAAIRVRHYSVRTERAYIDWIVRFIHFHGRRHPAQMGETEVGAFLSHLAVERSVAASTQNQALNALSFLYKVVLERPLGNLQGVVRAKRPERLPTVLTTDEVARLLHGIDGPHWLPACLMYGSGLRLMESVRLRVKDLDFEHRALFVRHGKGGKDRVVTLPDELEIPLKRHLQLVRLPYERDLAAGCGDVWLPFALARKYPTAGRQWAWQYVFPASRRSTDPRSGIERRHHIDESALQRAVRLAVLKAGIEKPASCHTLPLLRDPPAGARHGHPHRPGTVGPYGHPHDPDLHPRTQARRRGGAQSARGRAQSPGSPRRDLNQATAPVSASISATGTAR